MNFTNYIIYSIQIPQINFSACSEIMMGLSSEKNHLGPRAKNFLPKILRVFKPGPIPGAIPGPIPARSYTRS